MMSSLLKLDEAGIADFSAATAENLFPVIYSAGAPIFRENEPGGHAYIIERGCVQITQQTGDSEKIIATLGPGELFGEMSPIDHQQRSATATAMVETEVIPINSRKLKEIINGADPLVQLLLRVLIERLRSETPANRSLGDIGLFDDEAGTESIESVRVRALRQIKLEKELRDAFDRREFELYFQPIVHLRDYRPAGFEALIRWASPEKGIVGPNDFIGVSEDTGLIVPIGLWVMEHACHSLKRFQAVRDRYGFAEDPLFMSINVSARQLVDLRHVDALLAAIKKSGVDPEHIKIEITETLLLADPEVAIAALNRLQTTGVKIALDDFGTGYSSLSYLHRFPLDTIKIDRSFVMSMLKSRDSMTVIKTITHLAHDLKLNCVSEGIEDPDELTTLKELGCELGQGYLFSRPIPQKGIAELLSQQQLWLPPGAKAS